MKKKSNDNYTKLEPSFLPNVNINLDHYFMLHRDSHEKESLFKLTEKWRHWASY
jgi:hypothetical protein